MKAFKAIIKSFEAPQRSMKIKLCVNFLSSSGIRTGRVKANIFKKVWKTLSLVFKSKMKIFTENQAPSGFSQLPRKNFLSITSSSLFLKKTSNSTLRLQPNINLAVDRKNSVASYSYSKIYLSSQAYHIRLHHFFAWITRVWWKSQNHFNYFTLQILVWQRLWVFTFSKSNAYSSDDSPLKGKNHTPVKKVGHTS